MKKLVSLLAALALVLTLLPVSPASAVYGDGQTGFDGSAAANGSLSIRRDPDSDSVDLSTMDYPALFYAYPTLVVNGAEVPSSQYHITYTWNVIGLGTTPLNDPNSEYNCCEVYCPYSTISNIRVTCHAVAEYNGASYTADTAWNGVYRSFVYDGSASAQPRTCKVSFKPDPGSFNGSKEII